MHASLCTLACAFMRAHEVRMDHKRDQGGIDIDAGPAFDGWLSTCSTRVRRACCHSPLPTTPPSQAHHQQSCCSRVARGLAAAQRLSYGPPAASTERLSPFQGPLLPSCPGPPRAALRRAAPRRTVPCTPRLQPMPCWPASPTKSCCSRTPSARARRCPTCGL